MGADEVTLHDEHPDDGARIDDRAAAARLAPSRRNCNRTNRSHTNHSHMSRKSPQGYKNTRQYRRRGA